MTKKVLGKVLIAVLLILCAGIAAFIISNQKADIGFKVKDSYVIENINFEDSYDFYLQGYNWYKDHENDSGVFLLKTEYYDDDIINTWQGNNVYSCVPKKAFWYYTVSPSYLKTMGIDTPDGLVEDAQNGVRVFLIPDTYSEEEKNAMADYLAEDSQRALSDDAPRKPEDAIKTEYYENIQIEFDTYTPAREYFTYPCEQDLPLTENAPIIFICTANNMIYFESESLFATDVNSYIKFEGGDIPEKYADDDFIKKYDVKFNRLSEIYKKTQRAGMTDKGLSGVFEK